MRVPYRLGSRRVRLDRGRRPTGPSRTGCSRWSRSRTNIARFGGTARGHRRRSVGGWRCRSHAAGDRGARSTSSRGSTACPERSATFPRRRRGVCTDPGRSGRGGTHARGFRSSARGPAAASSRNALSASDEPVDPLARLASLADGLSLRTRRGRRPAPAPDAGVPAGSASARTRSWWPAPPTTSFRSRWRGRAPSGRPAERRPC